MSTAVFLTHYWACKHNLQLTAAALRRHQRDRLRVLVREVMDNSPFYRRHYGAHGIRPAHIGQLHARDLPPVSRAMLMAHFDEVVCDPRLQLRSLKATAAGSDVARRRQQFTAAASSGESGPSGLFVYSAAEMAQLAAGLWARLFKQQGWFERRPRLLLLAAGDRYDTSVAALAGVPKAMVTTKTCALPEGIDRIIGIAAALRPDAVAGALTAVTTLAQKQLAGLIELKPRLVVTTGAPMSELTRQYLTRAFGVEPVSLYSAAEALAMGAECAHGGLHLFEDSHIFETVDAELKPLGRGHSGQVLLTSLYNRTLPLIRYQLADQVTLSPAACPCGSAHATVQSPIGRTTLPQSQGPHRLSTVPLTAASHAHGTQHLAFSFGRSLSAP